MDNQFGKLPSAYTHNCLVAFQFNVSFLSFFPDCLGSKVFAPIKSDISGNITKIRGVFDKDTAKYATLQQIVEAEKETHGTEWPKVGATLALMWLKRGLCFIQILLQSLADGEKDENNPNLIRVNITKAYDQALKKYHSWLVQKIFKAALLALSKGQEVTEEDCMASVRQFLINFTATVDAVDLDYSV
uniref:Glycolipid transfer protein n=1 Tax=Salmo trutta TaxID=8032 RepID=A0A674EE44_SALTR